MNFVTACDSFFKALVVRRQSLFPGATRNYEKSLLNSIEAVVVEFKALKDISPSVPSLDLYDKLIKRAIVEWPGEKNLVECSSWSEKAMSSASESSRLTQLQKDFDGCATSNG